MLVTENGGAEEDTKYKRILGMYVPIAVLAFKVCETTCCNCVELVLAYLGWRAGIRYRE